MGTRMFRFPNRRLIPALIAFVITGTERPVREQLSIWLIGMDPLYRRFPVNCPGRWKHLDVARLGSKRNWLGSTLLLVLIAVE